jgi:hypothetical protein
MDFSFGLKILLSRFAKKVYEKIMFDMRQEFERFLWMSHILAIDQDDGYTRIVLVCKNYIMITKYIHSLIRNIHYSRDVDGVIIAQIPNMQ